MPSVKISPERRKKIRTLARTMNKQNIRLIPVTSQIIDFMNVTLTDPELDYLLQLGTRSYPFREAAALSRLPEPEFREFLETLLQKGFLQCRVQDGVEHYLLFPVVVGWFEVQILYGLKHGKPQEFARMADELLRPVKKFNVPGLRGLINLGGRFAQKSYQRIDPIPVKPGGSAGRKIAVDRVVPAADSQVYPTRTVADLIEDYGSKSAICIAPCICREWRKGVHEPCRFNLPDESCMFVGDFAQTMVRCGYGRIISPTEAVETLENLRRKGIIHTVYHERDDLRLPELAICNCCWDCCGLYGSYNRGIIPLKFRSTYLSEVADDSSCSGCGKCLKFCPTDAISVVEKKVSLDRRICVGCGQCAYQCPKQVFTLRASDRDVFLPLKKRSAVRLK